MRILRRQLMDLLEEARHQQGLEELPKRVQAALVHDALQLLPHPGKPAAKQRIDLRFRTITHGSLHRHLVTIRCPDQAFYFDAVKGYLLRSGIQPINQQTMVAAMQCDDELCEIYLRHPDQRSEDNFMFIALHLSATLVPDCHNVYRDISAILRSVDLSVCDFGRMKEKLAEITEKIRHDHDPSAELLAWMNENRYVMFGLHIDGTRLGLLRDYRTMERIAPGLHAEIKAVPAPTRPGIEWLHLAACQHYLYSATNVKVIRICWRDGKEALCHAILVGHFSRSARHMNASQLPCLSEHWHTLKQLSILQHSAFYRREVRTIYDRLPKSLLYSVAPESWLAPLKSIVDITMPTQVTVSSLKPAIGNLEYLLIAMPANRFGPNILRHIEKKIEGHHVVIHGAESIGIGPYRVIIVAIETGRESNLEGITESVSQCIIFWKDRARKEILSHASEVDLPATLKELEQLPVLYQELFPHTQFLADIQAREYVISSCRTMVRVLKRSGEGQSNIELHIITCKALPLGRLVDRIQAFGLTAMQEAVVDFGPADRQVRISCIRCSALESLQQDDLERLNQGLELVFNDEADHDMINALLTSSTLDINQVATLITLRNHLVQLLPDAAPTTLSSMMLRHPKVSERLLQIFTACHLPSMPIDYLTQARIEFEQAMNDVLNLSDDRWFRALAELIEAGVRTNAFVRQAGEPIGIKIDSGKLSFAPHPVPYRELFVHGVHVEGIHLRAGPVARGGIRFSDRPADFRTEVLDLMATQVVKNGQIVPTGSKGGFIVRDGAGGDFVLQQYRIFIRALLELTDNLLHGEAIAPDGVRIPECDRHDPYLVVAADKGTAAFSNDANEESRLACFWLDDAFASGGRHGYDHKVIGITARGAWVCAAHHFDMLGGDACNDPIRVVAIGDMGGDVFGNGMLLNPNLQLIAAFNHRHIFLDPNPDAKTAFAERKRLFSNALGWEKYNPQLISRGGGVFERNAKSISISDELGKALRVEATKLSGEALIQAILKAPADLLYNGGIGTYVKASDESHAEVQDPVNSSVRINADQLRASVVCEGGNLGFTQRARIEFASRDGIINTDAIDNSAGVDMSDHEVNLKILFSTPELSRRTPAQRNRTLKKMEEAVTELCLNNNLMQSRVLTLAAYDAMQHLPRLIRLRDTLIRDGRINPDSDPGMEDDETLKLRPQLAVLLGHEKNRIHDTLDAEDFFHASCFSSVILKKYFPEVMRRRYIAAMHEHPLASAIVHTQASNHIINHIGLTSIHHLQSLLDQPIGDIIQALMLSECLLDAVELRRNIWSTMHDKMLAVQTQRELQEQIMHFAEEILRLCPVHELDKAWIKQQQRGLRSFRKSLGIQGVGGVENSRYLDILKSTSQAGLSSADAAHLASMPELTQMASAVHISATEKTPLTRCLKATQAAMHLLPFSALESSLRTPFWADKDAHALRREWLHRLTLLKQKATSQLLQSPSRSLLETGKELWSRHRDWNELQQALHGGWITDPGESTDETEHLRLILALTHLESIIDES
ncbi:MAG: NAD-glutamate dehydrogenase [Mariprofundaceae bacterium]|nr:NAD-glutamate dehydrogenase [Mariprofundaceae bacterium]